MSVKMLPESRLEQRIFGGAAVDGVEDGKTVDCSGNTDFAEEAAKDRREGAERRPLSSRHAQQRVWLED